VYGEVLGLALAMELGFLNSIARCSACTEPISFPVVMFDAV